LLLHICREVSFENLPFRAERKKKGGGRGSSSLYRRKKREEKAAISGMLFRGAWRPDVIFSGGGKRKGEGDGFCFSKGGSRGPDPLARGLSLWDIPLWLYRGKGADFLFES